MTNLTQIACGHPVNFGDCWACEQRVGWVKIPRPRVRGVDISPRSNLAIDPQPHEFGTVAVLEDGVRAVDLAADWIPPDELATLREQIPLYVPHNITCPNRGLRRAGWLAKAAVDGRLRNDPARESRRQAKLRADRARN